ncbi:MAG: sulfotransferase family protein [Candidatus Woesearchaeota archaeon]
MKVCLIGGSGRSGTNIMKELLSLNSKSKTLPFEHRFTIDPKGIVDCYNSLLYTWSPYFTDAKIEELRDYLLGLNKRDFLKYKFSLIIKTLDSSGKKLTPFPYSGWEMNKWFNNYQKHVNNLISDLVDFEFEGYWPGKKALQRNSSIKFSCYKGKDELKKIFNSFFRNLIKDFLEDKEVFVEDNTWNILYAEELLDLVPNSKIIHMIRDPRDVVASFMNQRWAPNNLKDTILWYKSIIDKWFDVYDEIGHNRVRIVKLEDLIEDTEEVLKDVCSFLEIDFEEEMLDKDLSKGHSGRWKKEFDVKERKYLNNQLKDYIKRLEYV